MSSILLANPFPAPQMPTGQPHIDPGAALDLAPVQTAQTSNKSDGSASNSGSGAGGSNQADTVALIKANDTGKWSRPPNATGSSVVNAQSSDPSEPQYDTNEEGELRTDLPGSNLPEVEMPDPLPTSPFLKGREDVA
ncbi:hypothetical protein [Sulfitobacter noctilucicola]|uniref:Uncharacterized protein n=1 Tax=Sulfitobacter noctilucicola TaxID=1342301 RepID=A0A7W6Q6T5_9RHOB|nr:hypothetical protein [Sulfitobacter noctilucicola]MBB4175177.1 hypothetical protein [Sulfitobacter noctilucicola]